MYLKGLLLLSSILFVSSSALANEQNYGAMIERQAAQIKNLQNRVELLENKLQGLPPSKTGVSDPSTVGQKVDDEGAGSSAPAANVSPEREKPDYEMALATLKESKFEEAEEKFVQFIANYPNSKFQANAIFWYAETFYLRGAFNPAAINYLKSYKKAPQGAKAPDALLKLALSLGELNKTQEACNMLNKLEAEFPSRSEVSLSRSKDAKAKLRCK